MCIDYPGRVIAVEGDLAVVETRGRRLRANTLLVGRVAVGEWVTVTAGTIVARLNDEDAATVRGLLDAAATTAPQGLAPRSTPSPTTKGTLP
jgi:hydrogenase assembly chaperone HypC/HupF